MENIEKSRKRIQHLRIREIPILRNALYFLGSKITLVGREKQLEISPRLKVKFISRDVHHEMDELLGVVNRDGLLLTSVLAVDEKPIHISFYYKMLNKFGKGESALEKLNEMSEEERAEFILNSKYISLTPRYRRETIHTDLEEYFIFDSLSEEERKKIIQLGKESLEELKASVKEEEKVYQKIKL